ncbi:ATP-binding protein [Paenibacillus filicis]|uniref:ATP-binding protein n=1 Tax=Paenibacillus gyeongsangnamensis TaxID=3388067 RepID=A0ABT4Q687_9BACL|nr:magnesium chelatase domain-containing protein [Paenibacillus filicis]MCZ8512387.1 ATP-binding protein [Paenibacillus filicis]
MNRIFMGKVFFVMYGKVISACLHGVDGKLVEVEVDLSNGLPQMNIVGLPDSAIKESMERVRSAVKNCGFTFPLQRITVNLAPADIRKEGSAFDLAIAAGLLATSGQLSFGLFQDALIVGELSLDGTIRPVPGVLSMLAAAKEHGIHRIILPLENVEEASWVGGTEVIGLSHLNQLTAAAKQPACPEELLAHTRQYIEQLPKAEAQPSPSILDYVDVSGQQQAKRALMISAAGMHNILLIGNNINH